MAHSMDLDAFVNIFISFARQWPRNWSDDFIHWFARMSARILLMKFHIHNIRFLEVKNFLSPQISNEMKYTVSRECLKQRKSKLFILFNWFYCLRSFKTYAFLIYLFIHGWKYMDFNLSRRALPHAVCVDLSSLISSKIDIHYDVGSLAPTIVTKATWE